jgi:isoleucyl-tRNA synthetase
VIYNNGIIHCILLYTILFNLAIVMAPFTPFLSEIMYQQLNKLSNNNIISVHHYQYKDVLNKLESVNESLFREFDDIQRVINLIRLIRAKNNITLRKPISKVIIAHDQDMINRLKSVEYYIKDESNVLEIEYMDKNKVFIKELSPIMKCIGSQFKKDAKKVVDLIKNMSRKSN